MAQPTAQEAQIQVEQHLRGARLGVELKEYLLNRDVHSRIILVKLCVDWLMYEHHLTQKDDVGALLNWFTNLYSRTQNMNDEMRKLLLTQPEFWQDLMMTHTKCYSFQKLVEFLLHGKVLPSENLM
jgi:hypothetical protein